MSDLEFNKELKATETPIEGLVVYDLAVFGDNRGWFKENWQREKMTALGLPDFGPVQNNVSFNEKAGVTRGLHAEPWDKFVTIGTGRVFGAWCDIREGSPTYGKTFTIELDPTKGIFVPRGVANGFQTLVDDTVYMYLVNDHWSADAQYSNVSVFDESLGINWPIPLDQAELSDKDRSHPNLADAIPIRPKKTLIIGAHGQLGRALQSVFPDAECVDRDTFDMSDSAIITGRRWKDYGLILNAAAYTAVDIAETDEGRRDAWLSNATALTNLVRICNESGITLVHVSSDYVFDGTNENHTELEA
jgi:dTDP-4-dehydrorhamnose 3,5-epimerase